MDLDHDHYAMGWHLLAHESEPCKRCENDDDDDDDDDDHHHQTCDHLPHLHAMALQR